MTESQPDASDHEDRIIERLYLLALRGSPDIVQIEATISLGRYLHNETAIERIEHLAQHGKSEKIKAAAARALGGRELHSSSEYYFP